MTWLPRSLAYSLRPQPQKRRMHQPAIQALVQAWILLLTSAFSRCEARLAGRAGQQNQLWYVPKVFGVGASDEILPSSFGPVPDSGIRLDPYCPSRL